jgi:PAS domain S-box-containing protein
MIQLEPAQLVAAFDALDSGVVVLDHDQRVVCWNYWFASASDISSERATGKTLQEIFPGRALVRLTTSVSEALSLGSSAFLTYMLNRDLLPLRTRAGLPLVHNVSVRPFGNRPYSHCLLQISDVTGAAHRDRILRERQNARYDAVVESSSDAILTLDATGLVQFANSAVLRETSFERAELVGRAPDHLFEEPRRWQELWDKVLSGDASLRALELVARRKDGSRIFLDVSASRWMSDGRTFVTVILRDITERHDAEEALHELNANLEQRVEERTQERDRVWKVSRDLLGVATADGIWISVNPAWTQVLGWQPNEIIGKTSDWLEHPDDRRKMRDAVTGLGLPEQSAEFESSFRTREGLYRILSWTAVNVDGLLYCVGRDITEQRRQQDALDKAEDALRQAQKMEAVGQLTGGLAHDFNNLLTGISGALELLQIRISQGRYKDVERYISTAQGAANRAAALTHRLLAFSRRQTLDPKATDVNRLVTSMTDLINNTLGPEIEMTMETAPDLWTTLVDPNQLENALLNLCINARDAMPVGGKLKIETANQTLDSVQAFSSEMRPGGYVCLSVTDTGTGMSDEVVQRAFDPFYTTKPLGQGTGLGLSMIYGFAKQSGGQVRISSKLGQGTTIHLFLPRHSEQEKIAETSGDFSSAPRADIGQTVLIVDDEPSVRMLVTEVLAELGYTAIESADGVSALQVLRSDTRIDLLVTDVGLPGGMNGRQLADFGRTARPALKILFITGYAERAVMDVGGGLDDGMGILTKPFAMDGLAARIKELLLRRPTAPLAKN